MKREGYVFEKIISMDTLREAHRLAKRGKSHYREVIKVEKKPESHLRYLKDLLELGLFSTSPYRKSLRWESKKLRLIHALPYFPDRIVHHAIMLIMGDKWQRSLIRDTFQSLPGRGTSDARKRVQKAIQSHKPQYYLQIDIKKFYPSIQNWVLTDIVDRTVKCRRAKKLLYEIIGSCEGLPIGNYVSQILGNLTLSPVDWYAKQQLGVKHYFRYCDDIVILHDDPNVLASVNEKIESKINSYELHVKPNWCIRSVENDGLDFCGYVFRHSSLRLRQSIVEGLALTIHERRVKSIISYWGWVKPLNNLGLWQKAKEVLYENRITI